jgi:prevent-host-death family protein
MTKRAGKKGERESERTHNVEFSDERPEELNLADPIVDLEGDFLRKEIIAEFERRINTLPQRERLAVGYCLREGLSVSEIAKQLSCSPASAYRSIRNGLELASELPKSVEPLKQQKGRRRTSTMTIVTATKAKNEFSSLLEQTIRGGAVIITRHNLPEAVLIPYAEYAEYECLRETRTGLRVELDELLAEMQTAESKQAAQATFEASPAELGRAAVKQANDELSVQIASLRTSLMAACAANVVGRVIIKFSNDAA